VLSRDGAVTGLMDGRAILAKCGLPFAQRLSNPVI
jgi:hypothetical protein